MKKQQGFGAIEVVVIVGAVMLLGILGWVFWSKQQKANETGITDSGNAGVVNSEQLKPAALTPDGIIEKVKAAFAADYKLVDAEKNSQPKKGELSIRQAKTPPVYQPDGFDFYTDYDGGATITALSQDTGSLPSDTDTSLRKKVVKIYEAAGLSNTETRGSQEAGTEQHIYIGTDLLCSIEAPATAAAGVTASCGNLSSYKAAADKIKPIADALPDPIGSVLTQLRIEDGSDGYQRASVSQSDPSGIGGAVAVFYRKGNDGWKYFRHTQNALPCVVFSTNELKSAFKGAACYDDMSQKLSTVK